MAEARLCMACPNEVEGKRLICQDEHYRDCVECEQSFKLNYSSIKKGKTVCNNCVRVANGKAHSVTMKEKFAAGELKGFSDPKAQEAARQAIRDRYGVENASQIPEVREKIEATCIQKYGAPSPLSSREVQDKIRATNEARYGVPNVFQDETIKLKQQKTMLDLYGATNASQVPEIRAKQLSSMNSNHGVNQPLENPAIAAKQRQTLETVYGVKNSAQIPEVREGARERLSLISDHDFAQALTQFKVLNGRKPTIVDLLKALPYRSEAPIYKRLRHLNLGHLVDYSVSLPNLRWKELIEKELGVELVSEASIFTSPRARADLAYPAKKIAIDINPTISHSTQQAHPIFSPKSVRYHQERALDAERNGWLLYQIYDWTPPQLAIAQLRNLLGLNTQRIYARKCSVQTIAKDVAAGFLDKRHLQTSAAVGSIFYGLYYEGKLVQVMTFSAERFRGAGDGFELIRLASDGTVVGGASKLFSAFLREHNPSRVKTFASLDSGHGLVYEKMGFKFDKIAALNALYSKPDTTEAFKVTTCSQKFKTTYEELGMSQQEYMNSLGFYRINDAGNKIFVWEREEQF